MFVDLQNPAWQYDDDPAMLYAEDYPYSEAWEIPEEELSWHAEDARYIDRGFEPDLDQSFEFAMEAASAGPKLVVLGAILGCIFLALILSALTAGVSYSSSLASAAPDPGADEQARDLSSATGGLDQETRLDDCAVSERFPESVLQWCELITFYARQNGLAPDLLAALIWQESGGSALAYSHSGAVGLMQVMPRDGRAADFMCVNGPCFSDRPSTAELWDPEFNIAFGSRFLAKLVNSKGNLREGLKSYGPMNVGYYYADKVLNLFEQYGE